MHSILQYVYCKGDPQIRRKLDTARSRRGAVLSAKAKPGPRMQLDLSEASGGGYVVSAAGHAAISNPVPDRSAPSRVAGSRLGAALGIWIVGSVLSALVTLLVARRIAPAWAANTQEVTTIITFEVYTVLVASLVVAFPGRLRSAALRLQPAAWGAYLLAFELVAGITAAVSLGFVLAGDGGAVRHAYEFTGTDGERLGLIGPITVLFSVGRACILAPIGEELLFRGAIYGWSRRWLGPLAAILLNAALFAVTGVVGGSLFLVIQTFLLGAAINWVRERSGSTRPGIAVHVAHNIAIVLVVFVLIGR